jgi:hypothetical protein
MAAVVHSLFTLFFFALATYLIPNSDLDMICQLTVRRQATIVALILAWTVVFDNNLVRITSLHPWMSIVTEARGMIHGIPV